MADALLGVTLRSVSRSFFLSLAILPRPLREPVGLAYLLARMPFPQFPVALGVLYAAERPTYDETLRQQNEKTASASKGDLQALLQSGNTWRV